MVLHICFAFCLATRFVVSYYLADDTMSVFEPPLRNSGMSGGVFAKRQKMRWPGAEGLDYYQPQDIQVGQLGGEDTLLMVR